MKGVSVPSRDPAKRASPATRVGSLVALLLTACGGAPQTIPRQPPQATATAPEHPSQPKTAEQAQRPDSDPSLFASTSPVAAASQVTVAAAQHQLPSKTPLFVDRQTAPSTTWCRAVVHIGDSTSTGSMKEAYVGDPDKRLDAQLSRVGVEEAYLELMGGRSMVEHRSNHENGVMVAERLREAGFEGCWVVALGTNDAANVAKHPKVDRVERIERMMRVIGDDPVLWVDAVTTTHDGYWAAFNMQLWNDDLATTLSRYPNARIYRWSEDIEEEWWANDGIHYNSKGYTARARYVADALAAAFPGN
jgi:hypothetical protein